MGLEKRYLLSACNRCYFKSHPRLGKEEEFQPGVGRRSKFSYFYYIRDLSTSRVPPSQIFLFFYFFVPQGDWFQSAKR